MYEKSVLCLCGIFRIVRGLEDCRWIPPGDSVFCAAESLGEGI